MMSVILTGIGLVLLLFGCGHLFGMQPGLGALSLLLGFGFFALGLILNALNHRRS
jgi:hypothetical protein